MKYIWALILCVWIHAIDQYNVTGEGDLNIFQYENVIHIHGDRGVSLVEAPVSNHVSYISDTTSHDILLGLQPGSYYQFIKGKEGNILRIYSELDSVDAIKVLLDPGHGGKDPGAISAAGLREKDVVLQVGEILQSKLSGDRGVVVGMTRESDTYIDKYRRLEGVLVEKPNYLVSIHADAYTSPEANGFGVFCLKEGIGSAMSEALLKQYTDGEVVQDLESAKAMGDFLLERLKGKYKLHAETTNSQALVVLRSPYTTSILLELGFLSNIEEAMKLSDSSYLLQLSSDIAVGIKEYIYRDQGIISTGIVK